MNGIARPRVAVVDAPAGPASFARAVWARLDWAHLRWALVFIAVLQVVGPNGLLQHAGDQWIALFIPRNLRMLIGVAATMLAVLAADEAVVRGAPRVRSYVVALFVASALAAPLQVPLSEALFVLFDGRLPAESAQLADFAERFDLALYVFFGNFLYGSLACLVYVHLSAARLARARMHAAELAREQARRRTLESRLQAMQARVEPQFLFNTLAQMGDLYEHDAALGGRVLDDLITYLRAALPHLRESSSTLGQEVELVRAWLDIMRVRLGSRLAYSIDVPEATKSARLPPMLLLPLIDHALVHGLQLAEARGSIRIEARVGEGKLGLSIVDPGAGFVPEGASEHLLAIGERLHALYGDAARFELSRLKERGGTRAMLEIPHEDGPHGGDR